MNQKTAWTWLTIVFVAFSLTTFVGCGGNSQEDEVETVTSESLSQDFQEVKLTRNMVEQFIKAKNKLHTGAIAEAEEIGEDYEENGVLGKLGAIHRVGKFSEKMKKILKEEGFTPEKYERVGETVYSIVPLLLQENMIHEIEKNQSLDQITESTIAAFEEMLKNPHLSAEDKEEIKKQIEEQKANQENMQTEIAKGRQELEKFDPENVKIVKEYLEQILSIQNPSN